jgi:hypothetical protein
MIWNAKVDLSRSAILDGRATLLRLLRIALVGLTGMQLSI